MIKDPVCGMPIDLKNATTTLEYEDEIYYFCSVHCKKKFYLSPTLFADQPEIGPMRRPETPLHRLHQI